MRRAIFDHETEGLGTTAPHAVQECSLLFDEHLLHRFRRRGGSTLSRTHPRDLKAFRRRLRIRLRLRILLRAKLRKDVAGIRLDRFWLRLRYRLGLRYGFRLRLRYRVVFGFDVVELDLADFADLVGGAISFIGTLRGVVRIINGFGHVRARILGGFRHFLHFWRSQHVKVGERFHLARDERVADRTGVGNVIDERVANEAG
jgi:hypothetical protein